MRNEVFQFHIQALACGWCYGDMLINGKTIHFEVGYLGG